jgi:UDP-glucose 4-epimerase
VVFPQEVEVVSATAGTYDSTTRTLTLNQDTLRAYDEGTITVKELARLVAEECGITEPAIHMPDRPREVKHAMCSADKARDLLNYETTVNVKEAIKETADWIRSRGAKPFDYSFPLEIVNEKTPKTWKDKLM